MKRLIDYVKVIKGLSRSSEIEKSESKSETKHDETGSTIKITKKMYYFNDGVSVEYEQEYDDGGANPGCKEFWYSYKILNSHGFKFEGEKSKLFQSTSEVDDWLRE